MLARFFIDRPVLAWVISIVIVLFGGLAAALLPVAQYPPITPPTVRVTATYPGASAQVVADTVAAPIEQQVNGVENMLYMSSQSGNDGSYTLDVTFELGTDINMAQVLVQNRVAIALPQLADVVKATGVIVKKRSPDILLVVNLYSDEDPATGRPYHDQLYMSNYATINLQDALARLEGVGDIFSFGGQDYSMRVWLDPEKLASRNLSAGDVIRVLREQNVQVAAGQVGQPPVPRGQDFQYTLSTLGRLVEAGQFADIILNTGKDGEVTYLRDVARTELGARNQDQTLTLDGKPSVGLAVFQLPGSNALDVADRVKARMRELAERFPQGLRYAVAYDTTPFIRESVAEVFHTLRDAVILVAVVVLLFLQDWKALLLPVIDVGVSLVGTFAVMVLMGFSLNNLTLFGLVLAIGIVVDDAIVVLENIERWLEKGLPVREATIRAMNEITGPILAITLVLASVFLPSAFLGGITGQFFRQFALTISVSMIISAVNAMTMTPARAASIFAGRKVGQHGQEGKEALPWWFFGLLGGLASVWLLTPALGAALGLPAGEEGGEGAGGLGDALLTWAIYFALFLPGAAAGGALGWAVIRPVNWALGRLFRGFNWAFDRVTDVYGAAVGWGLRLSVIVLLVYAGLLGLTGFGFTRVPSGFIPTQDKGRLIVNVQLPDSAALERTAEVMAKVEAIAHETPGVAHTIGNPGRSFVLNAIGSNLGTAFVTLDPFHERRDPRRGADAVAAELRRRFRLEIPEARVNVFPAPAVDGLGNAGGFKLMVEAVGDVNYEALQDRADGLVAAGNRQPGLVGLFNGFRARTPQLYADIDRTKVRSMGVGLTDVFDTLQVYLGGFYVNDFNRFGRTWQVNLQADSAFRVDAEAVKQMKVRNADGDMVPLGSVVDIRDAAGPLTVTRYNMFPAATITGTSLPEMSTGDVLRGVEALAGKELPRSMTSEWTELSYLQKQAGKVEQFRDLRQNPFSAFVLGAVLVFFVLAGLYESWSLPLAVILVVPMCVLSALIGVAAAGMDVNIFVQVGFVVLVGLAAKNAILIVEFARDRQREGASRFDAALEAARVRLRPIVMTSFAFILGVVPLVIAQGAGAEMRRTLGTAVFAGMIGVTLFGIFLTPVFYSVVRRLTDRARRRTVHENECVHDTRPSWGRAMPNMRAVQVSRPGGPLELVERPVPEPPPGAVRIRVQSCGICHSDVMTKEGHWPGITYPRVPGHEVVGVIDAAGAGVPARWQPGQRVGVGWHAWHCGHCDSCRRGDFFACQSGVQVTGISFDGGYADYMIAPYTGLALVPDGLPAADASPLMCAGLTTFNALRHSGARPGDLVAVLGVGGLGHLGVQYAARMGFRTVAVARGRDKEALARQLGAGHYIDSQASDPAAELAKLGGAKVVLATVTHGPAMSATIGGLAPHGRLMVLGAAGSMEASPLLLLMGRRAIEGWYSGTSIDAQDTLAFSAECGVRSMNEVYPLERAGEAFDRMLSGNARFRVVLTTGA